MGSPVSVAVANLVMEDVEDRALDFWHPAHFLETFRGWHLYSGTEREDLLIHLNSIEESIQFTCEMESNGCLPFLDVLMSHQPDGSIQTSVYRKGAHTDCYLDYNSHHPLSHKKSVASTLINRAHTQNSYSILISVLLTMVTIYCSKKCLKLILKYNVIATLHVF